METDICTDAECLGYQAIWEDLFRSRNGISKTWFDGHVRPRITQVGPIYDGISKFSIHYDVTVDWATWHCADEFVVRIDSSQVIGLPVYVPNNVPLGVADIVALLDADFGGNIGRICPIDGLSFKEASDAIRYMQRRSPNRLTNFYLGEADLGEDRCPLLRASTEVGCDNATLDLATKEFRYLEYECRH